MSTTTFSPEGRLFQVEYAQKSVDTHGTIIGLTASDGTIVLGVEKPLLSGLVKRSDDESGIQYNRKTFSVEEGSGLIGTGIFADCKHIISRAREECQNWRENFNKEIPGERLADRLSQFMQVHTLYGSVRPFCCTMILASQDPMIPGGSGLWMMEPTGLCHRHKACAAGKGRMLARSELEKLSFGELSLEDAIDHVARILILSHDASKDKPYDLEISYLHKGEHKLLPLPRLKEAIAKGEAALAEKMDF